MSIRRARTEKKGKTTSVGERGEIGTLIAHRGDVKRGNKFGTSQQFLQKLDADLYLEQAVPRLTCTPRVNGRRDVDATSPTSTTALLTMAKRRNQPKRPPTHEWVNKTQHSHTVKCDSALKSREILTRATT